MPTEQKPSDRRRRTGRRPQNENRSDYRPNTGSSSRKSAPKLTFWQKICAFFTGKLKGEDSSSSKTRQPRDRDSSTQDRSSRKERTERPRPAIRKPEEVEVTTPRVYVGNLSFDASESDLAELFNGVGIVQNAEIVINKQTMRSKGFAFVQMQSVDEAKRAVSELHDKDYMGRKLVVSGAKAVEERRAERERERNTQQPEQ